VKGEVVYLYAFDVANEIATSKVALIRGKKPFPFQILLDRTSPKDVALYEPLAVELPPLAEPVQGKQVGVLVRVYEVGVVSIALRVAFECERLADLMPFHQAVVDAGKPLDEIAGELCARVCDDLRPFMVQDCPPSEPEAYTAFCLRDIPGVKDLATWLSSERQAVAGLLAETRPELLSEAQVGEVLRIQRSFEITDLVVIDWDAALVVDLTGYVDDVLYVLEMANLQLEEFRVMDRRLDRYLNHMYDDLDRGSVSLFGVSAALLRVLRKFRVDVAKLADEVTHITKFFGDWYLARVYLGARDRFYLDHWRQSVEQRLAQLDQLYGVVHSDIYDRRMLVLEVIIVVLFLIDVIGLFFYKR
jgi:hypothetical protein